MLVLAQVKAILVGAKFKLSFFLCSNSDNLSISREAPYPGEPRQSPNCSLPI